MARVAATGVRVEADAAVRARDLGEDPSLAIAMAEGLIARVEACAEGDRPVEAAFLASARAEFARASDDDDPALWTAAAAAWEALGRPYRAAQAVRRRAEALLARGEREGAAVAAAEALAAASAIGAVWLASEIEGFALRARLRLDPDEPSPPSAQTATDDGEDPFGLTPRERQVLALLADGRTNREIGAALYMAEKTASVHVSRILSKLDVRSRTEAAAVAHRVGLGLVQALQRADGLRRSARGDDDAEQRRGDERVPAWDSLCGTFSSARHGPRSKRASTARIGSGAPDIMATHYFPTDRVHFTWDAGNEPVLTIADGDTVVFETRDVSDNQIGPDSDTSVIADARLGPRVPARPARSSSTAPSRATRSRSRSSTSTPRAGAGRRSCPGSGCWPTTSPSRTCGSSTSPRATSRTSARTSPSRWTRSWARWASARRARAATPIMPPGVFGGNMDTRQLVQRHDALPADPGARRAVLDRATRTAARATARSASPASRPRCTRRCASGVEKRSIPAPQYRTAPGPLTPAVDEGSFFATTGVGPDLFENAQNATRAMIDHLVDEHDLSREDAYVLCSLVVDLKISEIVDAGQFVVSAVLPEAIFPIELL